MLYKFKASIDVSPPSFHFRIESILTHWEKTSFSETITKVDPYGLVKDFCSDNSHVNQYHKLAIDYLWVLNHKLKNHEAELNCYRQTGYAQLVEEKRNDGFMIEASR